MGQFRVISGVFHAVAPCHIHLLEAFIARFGLWELHVPAHHFKQEFAANLFDITSLQNVTAANALQALGNALHHSCHECMLNILRVFVPQT